MQLNMKLVVKKLKGFSNSQSKNNKFEELKKYLRSEKFQQEWNNYLLSKTLMSNFLASSSGHSWWISISFVHDDDKGRGTLANSEPQTL